MSELGGTSAIGGGGGQKSTHDPRSPLYGEGIIPPKSLRLRTEYLGVEGVTDGTDFAFVPGNEEQEAFELLVLTRHQELHLISLDEGNAKLEDSWIFTEEMHAEDACSPTNLLFDADYEENRYIYVTYCPSVTTTRLMRYEWTPKDGPSNPTLILEVGRADAQAGWHRFGSMGWEDDGETLWILLGEHEASELAQDTTSPLGSLLRIIPNREKDGSGYQIPAGNWADFPGAPIGTDPAIFAFGLRSPWRGMRDPWGRIWIGDVGASSAEELNLATSAGQNFGWPLHEGPCLNECDAMTDPVVFYDHLNSHSYIQDEPGALTGDLRTIWVGELLHDPAIDRYSGLLDDVVVFGDLFTAAVRGLILDQRGRVVDNQAIAWIEYVVAWKVGPDGYVYVLDLGGGLHAAVLDTIDSRVKDE
jgi:Glucose / Sorbosone dehydrogenase